MPAAACAPAGPHPDGTLGELPGPGGSACSVAWESRGHTLGGSRSTKEEHMSGSALTHRRLWLTAGCLAIGYVVLTFAGAVLQYTLQLGQSHQEGVKQLVQSSLTRNYVGGYLEYLATLVLLVGGLLFARLLRGDNETTGWLSSCMSGAAITSAAVTISAAAAGAAALYGAHHGGSVSTATTVNNVRNFAFFLSGGLGGVFMISAGAAGRVTGLLPRWLSYAGIAIGAFSILAVIGSRIGMQNVSIMLWLAWGVAPGARAPALRRAPGARAAAGAGT